MFTLVIILLVLLAVESWVIVVGFLGRRRGRPTGEQERVAREPEAPQRPLIHLVIQPDYRPVCGASSRLPWTEVLEESTCLECRRDADSIFTQWRVNNR